MSQGLHKRMETDLFAITGKLRDSRNTTKYNSVLLKKL